MRARNLKPGFFKNEILCDLDPLTRILFAGLWCMADREGRLEYRPKRIKVEILPYDNCNIEKLLQQLSKDFITIYEVCGEKYIQINKFKEHQNPHIKEAASSIPAPCKHSTSTVQAPDEHGSRPADSLLLIPESPLPITESLNPITDSSNARTCEKSKSEYADDFLIFWENYPKKVGKDEAWKAWKKRNGSKPAIDIIIIAIELQKKSDQWIRDGGQYIPNPATWINQGRWNDEPIEQHPLKGKVSEKTLNTVTALQGWRPPA